MQIKKRRPIDEAELKQNYMNENICQIRKVNLVKNRFNENLPRYPHSCPSFLNVSPMSSLLKQVDFLQHLHKRGLIGRTLVVSQAKKRKDVCMSVVESSKGDFMLIY